MANQVFLDADGIIVQLYDGAQDGAAAQDMVAQTQAIMSDIVKKDKPVRILANLSGVTHASLKARQIAAQALSEWPDNRVAVYSTSVFIRHIAKLVLVATKAQNARLFEDEATAKKWLVAA